jgi:hypothetical protein
MGEGLPHVTPTGDDPTLDTLAVSTPPDDTAERAATQSDTDAQKARSKRYGIAIKDPTNVTKPSKWADVPDDEWGDPVNYRYPMPDKSHADDAASRWGDETNREQYSSAEQAKIEARITKRQKAFGEDTAEKGKKGERAAAGCPEIAGTLYAPFTRRDDDKWEVEGVMTSEAIDSYGTIFDYESAKRAADAWAGNIREQHDVRKAVGRRVDIRYDDANKQIILRARISRGAPDTWAKICDGTLSGFSISAYDAKREMRSVGGRTVPCYTDYKYGEVSVVDVPSNPDAASSGLLIYRAAAFSADGADYVSDILATEPTAEEAPTVPAEPELPSTAAVAEPVAPAEPVTPPPSFDELVAQFGIPAEQREALARAVAQIAPAVAAQDAVRIPVSTVTTATTNEPAPAEPETQQRASVDTASGAGLQGNDLDDGSDSDKPIGKAMLAAKGYAHDSHAHVHASDYSSMHIHEHEHTHQDGTSHAHPHMHAHSHHDHFGDPNHSHPHTHVHDHSHEYRSAAPDTSKTDEPQPDGTGVGAQALAQSGDESRAGSHGPFTGKHRHAHAAFGAQGGDDSHEHEHSHDNDASHDHHNGDAADESERAAQAGSPRDPVTPEPTTEPEGQQTLDRVGQRISGDTRTKLHEAALAILRTCDCPTCKDALSLFDPDNDGDDDVDAAGDTDKDAAGKGRAVQTGTLTRRAEQLQRIALSRAARAAITTEVQREMASISAAMQQFRGIAARLTAVQSPEGELNRMANQLDSLRASVETVAGQVARMAEQDARVGPILRAADKTLGLSPQAVLDPSAPRVSGDMLSTDVMAAAIKRLQSQGLMRSQDEQIQAASLLIEQQMRQQGGR